MSPGETRSHPDPQPTGEASQTPRVPRRKPLTARVGVFGVGHRPYWAQFDGLLDEMHRKLGHLESKLTGHGVDVTNFGMIDSAEAAFDLLPKLKAADLDLVFCDLGRI